MKPGDVGASYVGNSLAAKNRIDELLHGTLIFLCGSRLAVLRDVFSQEAGTQFSNRDRGLEPVALRGRVFAAGFQSKKP